MLQEEQNIISLLSEPLNTAGFDLLEVNVRIINGQKTIQLYIDSPSGIKIDDCAIINAICKPHTRQVEWSTFKQQFSCY